MTTMDQQAATEGGIGPIGLLVDRASLVVRVVAQPSLVQLIMRFALAVPFWRSGILKWDGFLQLSDTAVTLFTDEFMLHLPGGPYPFPAPTLMGRNHLPNSTGPWPCHALRGLGTPLHDRHCRVDRTRRVAGPYHVGRDGAWHHGMGTRSVLD